MNRLIFTLTLILLSFTMGAQPEHQPDRCDHSPRGRQEFRMPPKPDHANFDSLKKHPNCNEGNFDAPDQPLFPPPPEMLKAHSEARTKVAQIRAQSDLMHEMIPIVAIIIIFTAAVLIVWITLRFNTKKRQAQFDLATKALASGKDIPAGLFPVKNEENKLNEGIFFISFGIGLIPLFWFIISFEFIWIGILFILIGIGQIISYYIQKQQNKKNV